MTTQAELLKGTLLGKRMELATALEKLRGDIAEALGPAFGELKERLPTLFAVLRCLQLTMILRRRWHIPYGIASWLSRHWPKRWLPKLKPELWEWDKGEAE